MKTAACLLVRNERESILEWIAFHQVVGFDTILVVDDASDDGTTTLVSQVQGKGDIRLEALALTGAHRQARRYTQVCRDHQAEFEWIAFLDADEFLVSRTGESLATLLDVPPDVSGIAVPWLIFGSSGHKEKPTGLIIEDYIARAAPTFPPSKHVKSLVRPGSVKVCSNPHFFELEGRYVLPDKTMVNWNQSGLIREAREDLPWHVHHYFTRSLAHWKIRMTRGQLGPYIRTLEEFDVYDRADAIDQSAAALAPLVRERLACLQN